MSCRAGASGRGLFLFLEKYGLTAEAAFSILKL